MPRSISLCFRFRLLRYRRRFAARLLAARNFAGGGTQLRTDERFRGSRDSARQNARHQIEARRRRMSRRRRNADARKERQRRNADASKERLRCYNVDAGDEGCRRRADAGNKGRQRHADAGKE